MSGRDLTGYVPIVTPKLWGAEGKAITGVMITIPAHGGGLFISEPNLRILADQLHDHADAYDNGNGKTATEQLNETRTKEITT